MNHKNNTLHKISESKSWDQYWEQTTNDSTFGGFGPQSEVLEQFWSSVIDEICNSPVQNLKGVDIASGNGTVSRRFADAFKNHSHSIFACDVSYSACQQQSSQSVEVNCFVTDANLLACQNDTIDFVVSQFGLEYAEDSFKQAANALKTGGQLIALCHAQGGNIAAECEINHKATEMFLKSGIFQYLYAAISCKTQSKTSQLVQAENDLNRAAAACQSIFVRFGRNVASGVLSQVLGEFYKTYNNLDKMLVQDVASWLKHMQQELEHYAMRMQSMLESAKTSSYYHELFVNLPVSNIDVSPFFGKPNHLGNRMIAWEIRFTKE